VAIVGSDVPHLEPDTVSDAFERLGRGAGLVLGPAEDGGYFLIGARAVPPVFAGVEWGGATVLEATLARARRAGIAVELLPRSYDVDTERDLRRLGRDIASGAVRGLDGTAGALERLGRLRYR
jgi:hypothetical protein